MVLPVHPLTVTVYVMVVFPGATPVAMPVPVLMVATDGLLLRQIPPDTPLELSGVVLPAQRASVPLILPALGDAGSVSALAVGSLAVQLL